MLRELVSDRSSQENGMSRMILLADDSITIQKIVNLTFSGEGIDVVTVGNGDSALKKIHEHRPNLVLADIFMPGKNGYEVCEAIKNDPELQSIPVILLVGAFEPFDGHEAARVKADSHLTKPFEIKALISAVRNLIEAAEQQAKVMVEPEAAPREAFVEEEEAGETVSAPALAVETIEEPVNAAPSTVPIEEQEIHIEEPPALTPSRVEITEALAVDTEVSEVAPEESPETFKPAESSVVPEPPVMAIDTAIAESREVPLPVIEETDPLGLESAEDGLGLAGFSGESITDTKSMVVEIWEATEVPSASEPVSLADEVAAQPSCVVESERAEITYTSEPLTESVPEPSARDQEVFQTVLVSPSGPAESIQTDSVIQPVPTPVVPPSASWGEAQTAELVDRIANKVVEKLSREVIEKIAWEVVPDMAVLMIKDQVESHFKTINDRS